MSNSSEGLTFEFVEFATELGYDYVYIQDVNQIQYYFSGPETRGSFVSFAKKKKKKTHLKFVGWNEAFNTISPNPALLLR